MLRNWNLSRFLAVHVPLFPHPQTYPHSFCPLRYLYLMQLHIFPHFLRCLLWLLSCYVAQKLLAQLFQLQLQLVVGVWRPSLAEKGLMSVLNFVAVMFRFILTNILFVQANKMENALKKKTTNFVHKATLSWNPFWVTAILFVTGSTDYFTSWWWKIVSIFIKIPKYSRYSRNFIFSRTEEIYRCKKASFFKNLRPRVIKI